MDSLHDSTYFDLWNFSSWEMEYLDIDKIEEDYDYVISDDEGNWFDKSLHTIELVVLLTAVALYTVFLLLMSFCHKGLIWYIYMLKAASLEMGCLVQIGLAQSLYKIDYLQRDFEQPTLPDMESLYKSAPITFPMSLWQKIGGQIWAFLFLMEEILALIFLYELYWITCALERRKQQLRLLCKKISLASFLVLVSLISFESSRLVSHISNLWSILISMGIPLHLLISTITTSFILNFGYRIVQTLKENRQFRNENGLKMDCRDDFLAPLVVVIMIGQCWKLFIRLAHVIWSTFRLKNFFSCLVSDLGTIGDVNKCFLNQHLELNIQLLVNFEVIVYFWVVSKLAHQN